MEKRSMTSGFSAPMFPKNKFPTLAFSSSS